MAYFPLGKYSSSPYTHWNEQDHCSDLTGNWVPHVQIKMNPVHMTCRDKYPDSGKRANLEVNINARLRQTCKQNWIVAPVLGLPGCHSEKWWKRCRYAELIRLCITTNWQCLRWAVSVSRALPPAFPNSVEKEVLEVLHLFRCSTHPFSKNISFWSPYPNHIPREYLHDCFYRTGARLISITCTAQNIGSIRPCPGRSAGHGISRSLWRWTHSTVHLIHWNCLKL